MAANYRERLLAARLAAAPALLLDGATGTELERRGIDSGLPLWSTRGLIEAPELVCAIHREYVAAGADAITANTFRTQARVLAAANLDRRDDALTRLAVGLAREAAEGSDVLVLGSAPPLEDCYEPGRVPDAAALEREHARHARNLADAGVDAILVETMNTVREAVAAAAAAAATGTPLLVSFVSWEDARLLSGEPLAEAIDAVLPFAPEAVLVNCLPLSAVEACLPILAASGLPFGAYANLGEPNDHSGFSRSESCEPERFADAADRWRAAGARILGGCCGTTPAHIAAMARRIRSLAPH